MSSLLNETGRLNRDTDMPIGQDDAKQLVEGTHHDPYSLLGMHLREQKVSVCAYLPGAQSVRVIDAKSNKTALTLKPLPGFDGLFVGQCDG